MARERAPRVLVVGGGGREHALVWALRRSPQNPLVHCAPGNAGTAGLAVNVALEAMDVPGLAAFAAAERMDLTIIGPEAPLAAGMADAFAERGLLCFGPGREAARIESSKAFARELMREAGVPAPEYEVFDDPAIARAYAQACPLPAVFKADGLAGGKGTLIARDRAEAEAAVENLMVARVFGDAGARLVVEEYLEGDEASVTALCDGQGVVLLPPARDYKRVGDGDTGPNTGGMGAFAPHGSVDGTLAEALVETVFRPTLDALAERGAPFRGALYAGLMLTANGPRVMEFNSRFGDPETQATVPLVETDWLALLTAAAAGDLGSARFEVSEGACVSVILAAQGYPHRPRTGDVIEGIERAEAAGAVLFHAGTAKRGGQFVTDGGRVLGVTATGATLEAARQAAYAAAEQIRFDGMHYRSDIGAACVEATV